MILYNYFYYGKRNAKGEDSEETEVRLSNPRAFGCTGSSCPSVSDLQNVVSTFSLGCKGLNLHRNSTGAQVFRVQSSELRSGNYTHHRAENHRLGIRQW